MATFIPTEKKKSILAGIGESVANAAMTVMKHKKDIFQIIHHILI